MDIIEPLTCQCGAPAPANIEQGIPYKCEYCGKMCVWPQKEATTIIFRGDNRLCPNCGLDNPTTRPFCRNCGESLTKRCPICDDEFYIGDNCCNNGHKYYKPRVRKLKPWIIVIVVVVVLCCFCIGAVGLLFAFGEPILHELGLYALLPVLRMLL